MFELLFRHPAADFRSGELIWASGWSLGLLGALLALLLVGCAWLQLGRPRRFTLRLALWIGALEFAAAALALLLLWRPALAVDRLESRRNLVAVLVDVSRSMSFQDGRSPGAGASRLARASAALASELLPQLGRRFELRLHSFGESLAPLGSLAELPEPRAEQTRIGPALGELLAGVQSLPLSAVVLVSDGGAQEASELGSLFAEIERAGVPIHTVGVGAERMPDDIELAEVDLAPSALPGSRLDARVRIRHGGRSGSVRLRVTDGDALLAARTIELDPARSSQDEFIPLDAGAAGVRDLRFALEPLPGEPITGNNAQGRVVDVLARPRRVLYLEGDPRWEYSFVRRAVSGDPALQLVSLLHTTDRKKYRQGVSGPAELASGFPATRAELFGYDALILGSVEAASLEPAQQALIRDFVSERGGGLLMLGGRHGLGDGGWGLTPVAEILPVRLERDGATSFVRRPAAVRLSEFGERSAVVRLDADPRRSAELWESLPAVADFQRVAGLKPGALALLELPVEGGRLPLLAVQRYGRGRSAVLASGGTWRWKMGVPHDDLRHATFWRQLLRFLAGSAPEPLAIGVEPVSPERPERLRVRLEVQSPERKPVEDAEVSAQILPQHGEALALDLVRGAEPGLYEAEFDAQPGEMYRVSGAARRGGAELASAARHLLHAPDHTEDFRPELNRPLLERIAAASGGSFWSVDDLAGLPEAIQGSGLGVRRREVLELWSMPVSFLLLLLLKGSAWLLRRRAGAV